jgi:adenylate cyclase
LSSVGFSRAARQDAERSEAQGFEPVTLAAIVARVRLVGGMILMLYVTSHLGTLALGVGSLDLLESWRFPVMQYWQNPVGQALLYGALASHLVLGLVSLAGRRSAASMRPSDIAQVVLGLLVPPLLALHVLTVRGGFIVDGFVASDSWMMTVYWKKEPLYGLMQVLVVAAAWIHGCLGLHVWLRLRTWWPHVAGFVYPLVFVLPILALLGFVEAGKEAIARLDGSNPGWLANVNATQEHFARIEPTLLAWHGRFLVVYGAAFGVALLVFAGRAVLRRRAMVHVAYVDGPSIASMPGLSILEISRANRLAHASACGGHGRCGTCRVAVLAGAENLSPPEPLEAATLHRIGVGGDVRLACQALLVGPSVKVERLIPPEMEEEAARHPRGRRGSATAAASVGAS